MCREAGARVTTNTRLPDLNVQHGQHINSRRIKVSALGRGSIGSRHHVSFPDTRAGEPHSPAGEPRDKPKSLRFSNHIFRTLAASPHILPDSLVDFAFGLCLSIFHTWRLAIINNQSRCLEADPVNRSPRFYRSKNAWGKKKSCSEGGICLERPRRRRIDSISKSCGLKNPSTNVVVG